MPPRSAARDERSVVRARKHEASAQRVPTPARVADIPQSWSSATLVVNCS
jgi:hypothetical protein